MTDNTPLSRRFFIKQSLSKVTSIASEVVERKAAQKAKRWVRPPFAIPELDFLLACNRCGDCVSACPHEVVFALPVNRGVEVASTPALDVLNKGCHLCSDWPCVTACQTNALSFSYGKNTDNVQDDDGADSSKEALSENMPEARACPSMAKASINTAECMPYSGPECGACKGSCPIENTLVWHNEKPSIVQESCVGCGLCREACITLPNAIDMRTY